MADVRMKWNMGTFAAIANAVLLALYYNLLAFLGGMRLYALNSAAEIVFSVLCMFSIPDSEENCAICAIISLLSTGSVGSCIFIWVVISRMKSA